MSYYYFSCGLALLFLFIVVPVGCSLIFRREYFTIWIFRLLERITLDRIKEKNESCFGFTLFCGRQGGGKTYSAVEYSVNLAKKYKGLLLSNTPLNAPDDVNYMFLKSIDDLQYLPHFPCYVVLLDEIQTLFDSSNTDKDFYTLFCQLRKRQIKIVGTTQVFDRVSLKLREQIFDLYYCRTFFGCLTRINKFLPVFNSGGKLAINKPLKLSTKYLIQTDYIRNMYNTYYKI